MDYSICQALRPFEDHNQVLIIYDICCQWLTHFRERVSESDFLEISDSLKITGAVGKWHLAAHIASCFPKWTLNFIQGAAQVDGEIMETLWSRLDEIAGLAQAMSVANHQETIDDYMNDSNWRKIVHLGEYIYDNKPTLILKYLQVNSLCKKWTLAQAGVLETKQVFEQLSRSIDEQSLREWSRQECVAMEQHGDHLKIYEIAAEKRKQI